MATKSRTSKKTSNDSQKKLLALLLIILFVGLGVFLVVSSFAAQNGFKVQIPTSVKYGSSLSGKVTDSQGNTTTMTKPDGTHVYAVFIDCQQKIFDGNAHSVYGDAVYYVQGDPNSPIKEDGTFTFKPIVKPTIDFSAKDYYYYGFFDPTKQASCTADLWAYMANRGQLGAVRSVAKSAFTLNP